MKKILSTLFSTLQVGSRWGLLFVTLLATTTVFGKEYYSPISVTDGTAADWDDLPAEYVASATHTEGCSYDGLKSVKVYCDDNYLNILLEVNLDVVTDLEWTLFHVFLNADGSSETGGYGDALFADADTEWMLETVIYANGYVNSYNPAVFKWWGEVGGSGWLWTDPDVRHDEYDCWGAIVCEGSYPAVGTSQMVDGDLGKVEIQLLKELIPAQWADEFTIGFDIQQSWTSCGILPNAPDDETGQVVRAEKLKVQVHHSSRLPQDGLYYEVTSNVEPYTVAVVGADADITTANIPETIEFIGKTFAVTSIGGEAFQYCSSLTSIAIPNSITSIGDNAFRGCSSLTSITIPNSIKEINSGIFAYCSFLTSITIPNSVTTIGVAAFENCSSLTSITIPNSVTSIGNAVFFGCSSLTSIIIPNSVTSIGNSAFYRCSSLTSITIPNSVTSIRGDTFRNCSSLTSITIPNSVTSIGGGAFYGCSSLTSMIVENGNTIYDSRENCNAIIETATNTLIAGCQNTIIPNSVTSIGDYAFAECSSLTSITIPNSVTSIGESAFLNCSSLTSVTIPNNVTNIGQWAFENCTSLNEITLPASVKSIGENAFAGCTKLYDIYCFAMEPPTAYESSFANYIAFLHVPCDNQRVYLLDVIFGNFKYIECIEAETTPTDTVVVTPSFNDAEFIWPSNSSADSYTLAISKDGEVFCTLTFNANGQLTGIAFAPSRNGQHNAPAAAQTANGFAFTVTGLDEGANYTYDLLIQDRSGNTLQSYSGEFRTQSTNDRTVTVEYDAAQGQVTGAGTYLVGDTVTLTAIPNDGYRFVRWSNEVEDNPYTFVISDNVTLSAEFEAVIPSSLENTNSQSPMSNCQKIIRDGQLLILRDGKTYTIMGAEIQ